MVVLYGAANTTDGIIENCFFKNNNSSGLGAAIHVTNNSSLILSNLTLTENSGKNAAIEIINATAIMSSLTIAISDIRYSNLQPKCL